MAGMAALYEAAIQQKHRPGSFHTEASQEAEMREALQNAACPLAAGQ